MSDIAIKVDHLSKEYRLGAIGGGTLRGDLQSLWARICKKEDPNAKIGTRTDIRIGEKFLALDDISFEVKKGEALGIIGHNGAGKSTLLKILSRVTAPSKGSIQFNGRIASMLEVGTGFHPELTGRENVYMNGAILGMSKSEIDKKFDEIVEFAEIAKFIDTPVKRYSSGMYVKLAFSVAAHLDSEIMIMDEVLAVGDMKFQQKCLGKMDDAANCQGRTVLYVSHNMNTIRQLCSKCMVLKQGRVAFYGETEKAIAMYLGEYECSPAFVDLSNVIRSPEFSSHNASFQSISLTDREYAKYTVGEKISALIKFTSENNYQNAHLRIIIKSIDDIPVMMGTSSQNIAIEAQTINSAEFTLDTSMLAPGRYALNMILYQVNEFGTDCYLDGMHNIVIFDVEPKDGFNNNMPWQSKYWGHIYNDKLEIKKG